MVKAELLSNERKGNNHFNTGNNSSSETSFSMNFTELIGIRVELGVAFDGFASFVTKLNA